LKRRIVQIVKWLAAVALIAVILWYNRERIREARDVSFEFGYLFVAGLLYLPALLLTFYRWFLLVRAQDLPFREVDALRLGFVGNFFNQFLPGSVGGDLVKAGFLASEQKRRAVAVATVIVDRFVGLYGLLVLASLCGAFFWQRTREVTELRAIVLFAWTVTTSALFIYVLPLPWERVARVLERLPLAGRIGAEIIRAFALYRDRWRAMGLAVLLAVIGHVGFVLSYYYSSLAVLSEEPTPSPGDHYMIIPVGMVVQAIPMTPAGNLGVSEGAFEYLYGLLGCAGLKGMLTSMAQRIVALSVALLGLIFYIPLRANVRRIMREQESGIRNAESGNCDLEQDGKRLDSANSRTDHQGVDLFRTPTSPTPDS
jgi:hypothetical protein